MNKEEFIMILQVALLHFDGADRNELISRYGFSKKMVIAGTSLVKYLRHMELEEPK